MLPAACSEAVWWLSVFDVKGARVPGENIVARELLPAHVVCARRASEDFGEAISLFERVHDALKRAMQGREEARLAERGRGRDEQRGDERARERIIQDGV